MRLFLVGGSSLLGAHLFRGALSSAVLTTAAQASKILVGFSVLKLIALYLGPEGLGRLGHFMSLISILVLLAGGGISHGVIKYAAEYKRKSFELHRLLNTTTSFALAVASITALLFLCFAKKIAGLVLGGQDLYWIISILAILQFGYTFNMLFSSFANGLGAVKSFAITQIIGNLSALPVAWCMISGFGLPGAAVGVSLMSVMAFVPAFFIYLKSPLRRRFNIKSVRCILFKRLGWFGLMLLVSAVAVPMVEIFIRQSLIDSDGYVQAGSWQAVIRMSSAYLGFFSVFLASYFMPMISATERKSEVKKLTLKFAVLVMIGFIVGGGALYLGRNFFIPLLLSDEFKDIKQFLIFQLVGDFFKVLAYVIGFVAVAKAATKLYIASEILQAGLFVFLSIFMQRTVGGAEGVTIAYMCATIIYFFIAIIVFFRWVRN